MVAIAVGTVVILYGNAIARSASAILMSGPQVMLAAFLLHASGFLFGYVLARMLGIWHLVKPSLLRLACM